MALLFEKLYQKETWAKACEGARRCLQLGGRTNPAVTGLPVMEGVLWSSVRRLRESLLLVC